MPPVQWRNGSQTWNSHYEGQPYAGASPTRHVQPRLRCVALGHRLSALIAPRGAAVTAAGATGYGVSGSEMHAPAC